MDSSNRLEKLRQQTKSLRSDDLANALMQDEQAQPNSSLGYGAAYNNVYMNTQGEEQSTRSSIMTKDPESASSHGVRKRSLANELKVRRQMKDLSSADRLSSANEPKSAISQLEAESPITAVLYGGTNARQQQIVEKMRVNARNILRQTDDSDSGIRIRPQTPKLNLISRNKSQKKQPAALDIEKMQNRILARASAHGPASAKGVINQPSIALKSPDITSSPQLKASHKLKIFKLKKKRDGSASSRRSVDKENQSTSRYDELMSQNHAADLSGAVTMQDQLLDMMENEDICDAVDLNERFLSRQLGIDQADLALLPKIELRVDTNLHNLQVTGEILASLESLRMSDSIIGSFRDLGTGFRNLRILYLARCGLKECQGIQAFERLEELYLGFNYISELFDIGFCDYLQVLDFEGNEVKDVDQLSYLGRCENLEDICLRGNPVAKKSGYIEAIRDACPNLNDLDEQPIECFEPDAQIESGSQHLPIVMRLLDLGVPESEIETVTTDEAFLAIEKEPDHMAVLSHKMHQAQEASTQVQNSKDVFRTSFTNGFGHSRGGDGGFGSFSKPWDKEDENTDAMRQSTRDFFKDAFGSGQKEAPVLIEELDDGPGAASLLRRNKKAKKTINMTIDKEASIWQLLDDFAPLADKVDVPHIDTDMIDEQLEQQRMQRSTSRVKVRRMGVRGGGSAQGRRVPSAQSRDRESSYGRNTMTEASEIDNFSAADVRFGDTEYNPPTADSYAAVSRQAPRKTKKEMDLMAISSRAIPRKDGKLLLKKSAVMLSSKSKY